MARLRRASSLRPAAAQPFGGGHDRGQRRQRLGPVAARHRPPATRQRPDQVAGKPVRVFGNPRQSFAIAGQRLGKTRHRAMLGAEEKVNGPVIGGHRIRAPG